MKVTLVASTAEQTRLIEARKTHNVDWPDSLPLPMIGDEKSLLRQLCAINCASLLGSMNTLAPSTRE